MPTINHPPTDEPITIVLSRENWAAVTEIIQDHHDRLANAPRDISWDPANDRTLDLLVNFLEEAP